MKILIISDTHGYVYNIENLPEDNIDIMFYGHYHTGFIKEENGVIFANPGSISLSKTTHSIVI